MTQQVQELIEKIKQEGIGAAEKTAREIEDEARSRAQAIVAQAGKEARQKIAEAEGEVKKLQDSARAALLQASRDTMISLRKKIESLLCAVVREQVSGAMTPEVLARVMEAAVKAAVDGGAENADITAMVNRDDLEKLEKGALAGLQKAVASGVRLQGSDDIGRGFLISFDGGKSSFDFSDQSLAEYLGAFLNARMAGLLKESV
jgi:V/A-type H+-transporting ATPase subunit E